MVCRAWAAWVACLLPVWLGAKTATAANTMRITVAGADFQPVPIAVPDFYGTDPESAQYAKDIAGVIRNNFSYSTPFKVLKQEAFLQTPQQLSTNGPAFADWKSINADALLTANVQVIGGNQVRVEYRLYDTNTGYCQ